MKMITISTLQEFDRLYMIQFHKQVWKMIIIKPMSMLNMVRRRKGEKGRSSIWRPTDELMSREEISGGGHHHVPKSNNEWTSLSQGIKDEPTANIFQDDGEEKKELKRMHAVKERVNDWDIICGFWLVGPTNQPTNHFPDYKAKQKGEKNDGACLYRYELPSWSWQEELKYEARRPATNSSLQGKLTMSLWWFF